ncbi:MAG: hypothetical protein IPL41_11935 [Micropruina sp.]|nr:hypothetical protein [Micropruina sp.]
MTTSGRFGTLRHPHPQQADATEAVHVDDVGRVRHQLREPELQILAERKPDAGARDPHRRHPDLAPVRVAGQGVRAVRFGGDQQHPVSGGQHLRLQELHRVQQPRVRRPVVVGELRDGERSVRRIGHEFVRACRVRCLISHGFRLVVPRGVVRGTARFGGRFSLGFGD